MFSNIFQYSLISRVILLIYKKKNPSYVLTFQVLHMSSDKFDGDALDIHGLELLNSPHFPR